MAQVLGFLAAGAWFIFIGWLNIKNLQNARETGIISKSGYELGPSAYKRTKSPFQYWAHYWGSVFAVFVCSVIGVGFVGLGIFLVMGGRF